MANINQLTQWINSLKSKFTDNIEAIGFTLFEFTVKPNRKDNTVSVTISAGKDKTSTDKMTLILESTDTYQQIQNNLNYIVSQLSVLESDEIVQPPEGSPKLVVGLIHDSNNPGLDHMTANDILDIM